MEQALDDQVAAVIVEPVQGEGGVQVPPPDYLRELSRICRANGSLLIVDEVQTGFCRTGPMFATAAAGAEADFLTMAKGIAGGFPLGAFATTEAVAAELDAGDHGGTYCGNPLACAVAAAVIGHLIEIDAPARVEELGAAALARMSGWGERWPGLVAGARGVGLLLLVEFTSEQTAAAVAGECLRRGVFVRQTQGTGIRVFPALTISAEELDEGLGLLEQAIAAVAVPGCTKRGGALRPRPSAVVMGGVSLRSPAEDVEPSVAFRLVTICDDAVGAARREVGDARHVARLRTGHRGGVVAAGRHEVPPPVEPVSTGLSDYPVGHEKNPPVVKTGERRCSRT